MKKLLLLLCFCLCAGLTAVQAKPLRVATDILPVHSLVARVMHGAGEPDLVYPPYALPHGGSLRPSQAAILAQADVIFWIGAALSPGLDRLLDGIATDATRVSLMAVEGTRLLQLRESSRFESHADAAMQAETPALADPHVWLDPENARLWVKEIADVLARADPDNKVLYLRNAQQARIELAALAEQTNALLVSARGGKYIVYHDAYHYFEARFDIHASGAVALSDGSAPGPARVSELRRMFRDGQATCLFLEPQFEPGMLETLIDGTSTKTAVLDPIGVALTPGKSLYPALIRGLAESIVSCLH